MTTREAVSFCRICPAHCGLRLTIDQDDRIVRVVGDKDHPLSRGYVCFKGLQAEEAHHGPSRLLHPLKRMPDGSHVPVPLELALDEIADKMSAIIDRDGPEAIAGFMGNGAIYNHVSFALFPEWLRALGTPNYYTTMTIDQPAKMVTPFRMGYWAAGRQLIPDSEVTMLVGANTLASHSTNHGLIAAPTKTIKEQKKRGLKLVVIDPRYTETARYADVFLQPYPGEDPTLLSGILNCILKNEWHDAEFCAAHLAEGEMQVLRDSISVYDLDYVAERSGVPKEKIVQAAAVFARDCSTGPALSATGPAMSPRGNLSDHLVELLNVVCGRFRREGERYTDINPWHPSVTRRAEVIAPSRPWENEPAGRVFNVSSLVGEKLSVTLADEVLTPGKGQVKCLINASGNPAISMPDKAKFASAMEALELLVTVDPFMTLTAQHSDYVIPPKMMYERYDMPLSFMGWPIYTQPWGQVATPLIAPPQGSEVVDDWYIYWGLARRLGKPLSVNGEVLDMNIAPTTEQLLKILSRDSLVPYEDIKQYPSGRIFDVPEHTVQAAEPGSSGKFDVIPEDVRRELEEVRQETVQHGRYESNGEVFTHRLTVRRLRNVMNTVVHQLDTTREKYGHNPAWLHPDDLDSLGLKSGDRVVLVSDHGQVTAIVEADDTMRCGVVSICHGYGGNDDDADVLEYGSSVNLLISSSRNLESITAMVRMSGIPVNIEKLAPSLQ